MITAKEIVTRALRIMHDEDCTRWSEAEMLDYTNEAQYAVCLTPGVYTKTSVINLVEGTRQALPAGTVMLLSIVRNVEDDVPLTPVKITTRELLDAYVPDWHMAPVSSLVENYIIDDRTSKQFYVYPPNDGTGHVEIVTLPVPPKVTSMDDELVVDDVFMAPLADYVVYRAYCKESDYSAGITQAQAYYQAFQSGLAYAMSMHGQMTPLSSLMPNTPANTNGGTE